MYLLPPGFITTPASFFLYVPSPSRLHHYSCLLPVCTFSLQASSLLLPPSSCMYLLPPGFITTPASFFLYVPSPSRLHHYSCLLLPVSSFSELFPWERISLLVEYNLTASDNGGTVHGWAITDHASYLDRHASLLKKYKHIDVYTLKGAGSKNAPAVTGPRVTLRPGRILVWHSQPILSLSFLGTDAQ